MAYQPPGPYPVMPMQPVLGAPPRPPIPPRALRAYYAILAGAGLSVVSAVITMTELSSVRDEVRDQLAGLSDQAINMAMTFQTVGAIMGGVIDLGLWLWMAWKIKAGRHWARVLSSVFFGFAVLSALFGGINFHGQETAPDGRSVSISVHPSALAIVFTWVMVAVGLYALVMFWNKNNAAFFRPRRYAQPAYPYPYPQPGFPPQGYPQPGYPQIPEQGAAAPQVPEPQQPEQPGDPWATPPQ